MLQKTQKQMAELLGTSIKAVQSFEQGWRAVPPYIERQMLFLLGSKKGMFRNRQPCWDARKCPPENRTVCPAWEFQVGNLCWLINGTICQGQVHKSWAQKISICRSCKVLAAIRETANPALKGKAG